MRVSLLLTKLGTMLQRRPKWAETQGGHGLSSHHILYATAWLHGQCLAEVSLYRGQADRDAKIA
ncbi:MAG: hypothetical protein ACLP7P_06010 [Rhodomicrobium sp.]